MSDDAKCMNLMFKEMDLESGSVGRLITVYDLCLYNVGGDLS